MCLDNANEQLDNNQIEIAHLKTVIEKLEINEKILTDQLANAHIQYQECKRKLESTLRSLEEQNAKDQILGDEIKVDQFTQHSRTKKSLFYNFFLDPKLPHSPKVFGNVHSAKSVQFIAKPASN